LIFFCGSRNAVTYEFDLEVLAIRWYKWNFKVKEISEIPSGYSSGDPTYDKESITGGSKVLLAFVVNRFNEHRWNCGKRMEAKQEHVG
jgi:hypothetical protein